MAVVRWGMEADGGGVRGKEFGWRKEQRLTPTGKGTKRIKKLPTIPESGVDSLVLRIPHIFIYKYS